MNKNIVLIVVAVFALGVVGAVSGLIAVGSLPSSTGVPIITGTATLVLGALLALLDPTPTPPTSGTVTPTASSSATGGGTLP